MLNSYWARIFSRKSMSPRPSQKKEVVYILLHCSKPIIVAKRLKVVHDSLMFLLPRPMNQLVKSYSQLTRIMKETTEYQVYSNTMIHYTIMKLHIMPVFFSDFLTKDFTIDHRGYSIHNKDIPERTGTAGAQPGG